MCGDCNPDGKGGPPAIAPRYSQFADHIFG
jgi:hypothetical protein